MKFHRRLSRAMPRNGRRSGLYSRGNWIRVQSGGLSADVPSGARGSIWQDCTPRRHEKQPLRCGAPGYVVNQAVPAASIFRGEIPTFPLG
jgi:hypothetical protein